MHEYDIARLLLKIGAVSMRPNNPYQLASGIISPIYIDCRILNSYPEERKVVFGYFQEYIDSFVGRNNVDMVVGSGHSGVSLATFLVEKMRVPMAYIRASHKGHGKENQIEGHVRSGDRALLISDIIADEEHIPISVRQLKEKGARIVHVLSIFNMKLDIVDTFLKNEGIPYFTLTDLRILLKIAVSDRLISLTEREEIERWRKNYTGWGATREQEIHDGLRQRAEGVAGTLLSIGAVTLSPSDPYRYASGILSPIYCDNRLLISHPDEWLYVINSMLNIIVNVIGMENIDIIGGTSTAGIPHAAFLSERLQIPMIYIKSTPEAHGKQTKIEGSLAAGKRVVVIEDLISTGGSSIRAVESVRDAGGTVTDCIAIFTYEMEEARRRFAEIACTLHTVSNFSTLIAVAEQQEIISSEELTKAMEWNKAPEEWGRAMGYADELG